MYSAFKITSVTDRPEFKTSQTSVIRRYSDFVWLEKRLQMAHPVRTTVKEAAMKMTANCCSHMDTHKQQQGAIVPPLPEKVLVGRFELSFVEARRRALRK